MKKYVLDLRVTENLALHTHYVLLKATSPDGSKLPESIVGIKYHDLNDSTRLRL